MGVRRFFIFLKSILTNVDITDIINVTTNVDNKKGDDKMSVIKQTITDAEYEIMSVLWSSDELLTVADIIKRLDNNDWSASTVATFMARLLKKEVISCERRGKVNYYYPVLKQSEYAIDETENLLAKMFKGSIKNLVATLYENKKLSNEEVADLKKMFELE